MSRYETKLKDKLNDEIKLAGLEALVLEELEKHLTLNFNRLRTFEDAHWRRREFVKPSRVTRVPVDTQIPWMLRSTLSILAQEKGHRVRVMGV